MQNRLAHNGFTLIELIFVIVIIGVLSAVAIPQFSNLTNNSKTASELATASSVQSALDAIHGEWITNTCDFDWGNGQTFDPDPSSSTSANFKSNGYPTAAELGDEGIGNDPFGNLFKNKTTDWYRIGNKYYGPSGQDGKAAIANNGKPEKGEYWLYNDVNGTFTLSE